MLQPQTKTFLRRAAIVLLIGIIFCTIAHALVHQLPNTNLVYVRWLIREFDLDTEKNVPTWFASVLWLSVSVSAFLSFLMERIRDKRKKQWHPVKSFAFMWLVISAVFFVASCDEVATIHETIGEFMQDFRSNGPLGQILAVGQKYQSSINSPWIIYYAPVLIIFGIGSMAFLYNRLKSRQILLIFCFMTVNCYVLSIAMDHYQGQPWEQRDSMARSLGSNGVFITDLSVIIEETLENLGCAFLILAFAAYAHDLAIELLNQMSASTATIEAAAADQPESTENPDNPASTA